MCQKFPDKIRKCIDCEIEMVVWFRSNRLRCDSCIKTKKYDFWNTPEKLEYKKGYHKRLYEEKKKDPLFLESIRTRNKEQYHKHLDNVLYKGAKFRSKKFGTEFNIERSDVVIPDMCPILNVTFVHNTEYAASLDRIDNSKGYIKGNVQVISRRANLMKNAATEEDLVNFAKWVNETYRPLSDYEEELG